ncbi:MAG TPA: outer membrane protein [Pseudolabrys sp.]|jgi:opacity protein-like surface antigen
MSGVGKSVVAAALALSGVLLASGAISSAMAADMPGELPPPAPGPVLTESVLSGWYLRGDVGAHWGATTGSASAAGLINPINTSLGSGVTAGLGVGIKTKWLRTDVTLDYAAPVNYRGTQIAANDATGKIQATTALFNGYIDLGTWYGFTPYIGAGAGLAFARMSDLTMVGVAAGESRSKTNFAYAGMAGVAWTVAPNLQIDLGYRYLNIGDVKGPQDVLTVRNVAAQEVRVGLRWSFDDLPLR